MSEAIEIANSCNYDAWFQKLDERIKRSLFNYAKFGIYCARHKKPLVWNATKNGGGGYDDLTNDRPINKDACFSFIREELRCSHYGCHTKIILTHARDEIRDVGMTCASCGRDIIKDKMCVCREEK